jgi:hypothetical protein
MFLFCASSLLIMLADDLSKQSILKTDPLEASMHLGGSRPGDFAQSLHVWASGHFQSGADSTVYGDILRSGSDRFTRHHRRAAHRDRNDPGGSAKH